jgi:predicted nucleic acid-binding protein
LIIDASVASKFVIEEEGSDRAQHWISRAELLAPTLLHAEVGNAIWKRVQKGEMAAAAADVAEQLEKVASIVRTIDETPTLPRAVELAIELKHPVYDCVYLALAEQMDDELLTADRRFLRAVEGTRFGERVRSL